MDKVTLNNHFELIENLKVWIPLWNNLPNTWTANFDNLEEWLKKYSMVKKEQHFNYVKVGLEINKEHLMAKPFHWDGSSCKLTFDIRVKEIPEGGQFSFGIFAKNSKKGLLVFFISVGGTSSIVRLVQFNSRSTYAAPELITTFDTEIWYYFEIKYFRELKKAQVVAFKRSDRNKQIGNTIISVENFMPGKRLIGFAPYPIKRRRGQIWVDIENIKLWGEGWK